MINAVLYSDQVIPENGKIDMRLVELMKERGCRIGYVPSGPDPERRFFREKQAYYARRGLRLDVFHDLDRTHDESETEALLTCDAIHLSGGDTVAFLGRLRRSGMFGRLRAWAAEGGLLVGTSAGAILMTPTIALHALFEGMHPAEIGDATAFGLVPFEFFPHVQAEPRYFGELVSYSAGNGRPIAACPDGDGIVVANGEVECLGNPIWISDGAIVDFPF